MPKPTVAAGEANTSAAQRVRERFTAALNKRVEIVTNALIKAADTKVDAYFNDKLEAGLDPYALTREVEPASQRYDGVNRRNVPVGAVFKPVAEIELFDAQTEFASGNNPEVKAAYDLVAQAPTEWAAVIERVKKHHEKAGFRVYFATDVTDATKIVLQLHDPQFEKAVGSTLKID